jgi:hypothetical protein
MLFNPKKSGASIKWKYAIGFVEFGGKGGQLSSFFCETCIISMGCKMERTCKILDM